LIGLKIHHFFVLVATESEHAVVHCPSLLNRFLFYKGTGQDLLESVVLSQTAKKGLELTVSLGQSPQSLLPLPLNLSIKGRLDDGGCEGHPAHGFLPLEDCLDAIVLSSGESGRDIEGQGMAVC
jgi:hypothetical protein